MKYYIIIKQKLISYCKERIIPALSLKRVNAVVFLTEFIKRWNRYSILNEWLDKLFNYIV